jgi:inositol phosphorylceramide mannosyltransferase catalytic subunit
MNDQIPKRIIQTARDLGTLSLKQRAVLTNLRLLHPEYEYSFFSDETVRTFLAEQFPEYRPAFAAFRFPIQRYDFFRYLAVYHYGGFYFDMDVLLATKISGLLHHGCVFPFEGLTFSQFLRAEYAMDWQIGNYAFGAVAKHPFLAAIIDNCVRCQRDPAWVAPMMRGMPRFSREQFWIMNTSGPGLISRTLAENPGLAGDVAVLFPADVCDPSGWNRFGDIGIHLMDGSWRPNQNVVVRRLAQLWEVRKMRRLIAESRRLGSSRDRVPRGAQGGQTALTS